MNCVICDCEIHPKRVKILIKQGQRFTCVNCSAVEKNVGFQVHHDKACREIQICSPSEGKRLKSLERKTGGATGGPAYHFGELQGKVVYKKPKQ